MLQVNPARNISICVNLKLAFLLYKIMYYNHAISLILDLAFSTYTLHDTLSWFGCVTNHQKCWEQQNIAF